MSKALSRGRESDLSRDELSSEDGTSSDDGRSLGTPVVDATHRANNITAATALSGHTAELGGSDVDYDDEDVATPQTGGHRTSVTRPSLGEGLSEVGGSGDTGLGVDDDDDDEYDTDSDSDDDSTESMGGDDQKWRRAKAAKARQARRQKSRDGAPRARPVDLVRQQSARLQQRMRDEEGDDDEDDDTTGVYRQGQRGQRGQSTTPTMSGNLLSVGALSVEGEGRAFGKELKHNATRRFVDIDTNKGVGKTVDERYRELAEKADDDDDFEHHFLQQVRLRDAAHKLQLEKHALHLRQVVEKHKVVHGHSPAIMMGKFYRALILNGFDQLLRSFEQAAGQHEIGEQRRKECVWLTEIMRNEQNDPDTAHLVAKLQKLDTGEIRWVDLYCKPQQWYVMFFEVRQDLSEKLMSLFRWRIEGMYRKCYRALLHAGRGANKDPNYTRLLRSRADGGLLTDTEVTGPLWAEELRAWEDSIAQDYLIEHVLKTNGNIVNYCGQRNEYWFRYHPWIMEEDPRVYGAKMDKGVRIVPERYEPWFIPYNCEIPTLDNWEDVVDRSYVPNIILDDYFQKSYEQNPGHNLNMKPHLGKIRSERSMFEQAGQVLSELGLGFDVQEWRDLDIKIPADFLEDTEAQKLAQLDEAYNATRKEFSKVQMQAQGQNRSLKETGRTISMLHDTAARDTDSDNSLMSEDEDELKFSDDDEHPAPSQVGVNAMGLGAPSLPTEVDEETKTGVPEVEMPKIQTFQERLTRLLALDMVKTSVDSKKQLTREEEIEQYVAPIGKTLEEQAEYKGWTMYQERVAAFLRRPFADVSHREEGHHGRRHWIERRHRSHGIPNTALLSLEISHKKLQLRHIAKTNFNLIALCMHHEIRDMGQKAPVTSKMYAPRTIEQLVEDQFRAVLPLIEEQRRAYSPVKREATRKVRAELSRAKRNVERLRQRVAQMRARNRDTTQQLRVVSGELESCVMSIVTAKHQKANAKAKARIAREDAEKMKELLNELEEMVPRERDHVALLQKYKQMKVKPLVKAYKEQVAQWGAANDVLRQRCAFIRDRYAVVLRHAFVYQAMRQKFLRTNPKFGVLEYLKDALFGSHPRRVRFAPYKSVTDLATFEEDKDGKEKGARNRHKIPPSKYNHFLARRTLPVETKYRVKSLPPDLFFMQQSDEDIKTFFEANDMFLPDITDEELDRFRAQMALRSREKRNTVDLSTSPLIMDFGVFTPQAETDADLTPTADAMGGSRESRSSFSEMGMATAFEMERRRAACAEIMDAFITQKQALHARMLQVHEKFQTRDNATQLYHNVSGGLEEEKEDPLDGLPPDSGPRIPAKLDMSAPMVGPKRKGRKGKKRKKKKKKRKGKRGKGKKRKGGADQGIEDAAAGLQKGGSLNELVGKKDGSLQNMLSPAESVISEMPKKAPTTAPRKATVEDREEEEDSADSGDDSDSGEDSDSDEFSEGGSSESESESESESGPGSEEESEFPAEGREHFEDELQDSASSEEDSDASDSGEESSDFDTSDDSDEDYEDDDDDDDDDDPFDDEDAPKGKGRRRRYRGDDEDSDESSSEDESSSGYSSEDDDEEDETGSSEYTESSSDDEEDDDSSEEYDSEDEHKLPPANTGLALDDAELSSEDEFDDELPQNTDRRGIETPKGGAGVAAFSTHVRRASLFRQNSQQNVMTGGHSSFTPGFLAELAEAAPQSDESDDEYP